MNKKYQVFISSTYSDLVEERAEITKSILDMGHIPAGMESFLSADVEQFKYIKKVIDQCDYYVLIIAGRYGSEDSDGVGFTEKEFDYAVANGKTVLAAIHSKPETIQAKYIETENIKKEKLSSFISKVKSGRLVSFWSDKGELKSNVIISLSKAMSDTPGTGWIRGDAVASEEILSQVNSLRIENQKLDALNRNLKESLTPGIDNLAGLNDIINIKYRYYEEYAFFNSSIGLAWKDIFSAVGPEIVGPKSDSVISSSVINYIREKFVRKNRMALFETDKNTIKLHLMALKLIKSEILSVKGGGVSEFISLTEAGLARLSEIMAVKAP